MPGSPATFGSAGPVRIEDVPAGRLRDELWILSPKSREAALRKLGDLRIPFNDVASLHVDRDGQFYYECTTITATHAAADTFDQEYETIESRFSEAGQGTVPISTPPARSSKPGAAKVIYLDFNGHTITGTVWNNGGVVSYVAKPFSEDGDRTSFSESEQSAIIGIWERVAEDFKAFDVNVTTVEPVDFTSTTGRVLITDNVDANGVNMPSHTASGVAYIDVFGAGNYASYYSPAIVYANQLYQRQDYVAETVSHEIGHNLSLSHDGTSSEEYYGGHGEYYYYYTQTSWGPIMGGPFNRQVTQWSKGEYYNANNSQDDLAIIAGHLGYNPADGDDTNGAATALGVNGSALSGQGEVGGSDDGDRFSFTVAQSAVSFTVTPFRSSQYTYGGNLDVKLELYDAAGLLVAASSTESDSSTLGALTVGLNGGTYYLRVSGTGAGNPLAASPSGYTAYGSMGQYTVSGVVSLPVAPTIASHPYASTVTAGQSANFYAGANGNPSPSPRWQRLPAGSGTWINLSDGDGYSGTSTYYLGIAVATSAMNGDQFRCAVTNIAGTVTSNPATLTVNPAVAPAIYNLPALVTVNYGDSVSLYPSVTGTQPITFQWKKDGVNVANGTYSSFYKSGLTTADSGVYTLTATNYAGTTVSSNVTVTVNAAVAPAIYNLPATVVVNYGEYFSLSPSITGTQPMTFQWKKDGVDLASATSSSFYKSGATTADSGVYTLTATNLVGSTVSSNVTVTVNAAVAPAIYNLPATVAVNYGEYFSLYPSITGTQPMTFRWKKDGVDLANATSSSFYKSGATTADSGVYTLTATNLVGSTVSSNVTVTVNAAVAPAIYSLPATVAVNYGEYFSLYPSITGTQPMTFQWKKDGVILPNGTSSSFSRSGATTADNGVYTLTATNLVGSTVSSDVTITVNAAVAPAIYNLPATVTVKYGEYFGLSASISGTQPMTFQWKKDGVVLPNGTSSWFSKSGVTTADSGVYTLTATNLVGSTVSSDVTVTVNAAVAPVISSLPVTATVNYGEYLGLFPSISGTQPMTFQWKKDGVVLPNGTSSWFSKNGVTTADSGVYTLSATNLVGTTVSADITVTVKPVIAPVITQQPVSVEVAKGFPASFNVAASGSPTLVYEWYKDGRLVPGGSYSSLSFSSVTPADSGNYAVRVTNAGGNVSSMVVSLTVLPAAIPKINSWTSRVDLWSSSPYLSLYASITGTSPMTYQWYKDGVAIPGANYPSYSYSQATAATAGTYTLRVANEAGITVSPDAVVTWMGSGITSPWLDAVQLGDVAYFLFASPGRIMRYDLATETWLATVDLPNGRVPTAFLPTPEGVFIAYDNHELVRRPLDLSSEAAVATITANITSLFSHGDLIYFREGETVRSRNRQTLAAGPDSLVGYYSSYSFGRPARPAHSEQQASFYTSTSSGSPQDVMKFEVAANGVIGGGTDSPYHGDFSVGTRQYLSPDETQLFDNSGVIYDTATLKYAASLGRPFYDVTFLADGTPVALRGQDLTSHGGSAYVATGQYRLAATGYALFSRANTAFAFTDPASPQGVPGVTKVEPEAFVAPTLPVAGNPSNKLISVEDAFIDSQGVIHLISRSERGIVRWNAKTTRSFLPTLPLRGAPMFAHYAPAVDRLAMVYGDGAVTDIFPGNNPSEEIFAYTPTQNTPFALIAMDELTYLNIRQATVSADLRIVLGSSGELKSLSSWSYWTPGRVWQSATRRLYTYAASSYNNSVGYLTIAADGTQTTISDTYVTDIVPPLSFNEDGTLAVSSNKRILNADLGHVGTLENGVADAVWLPSDLFTIRTRPSGTEVQRWSRTTYARTGSVSLPGTPLRIFKVDDDTVVVVSLVNGYLAFSVLEADLSLASYSVNTGSITGMPVITQQPVGQTVRQGDAATFTVAATGTPAPAFQWQRNGINIDGATGSSYVIPSTLPHHGGTYRVVITNSLGAAISQTVRLTVNGGSVTDFNADGQSDLVWQNRATGQRALWLMNGGDFTPTNVVSLGWVDTNWTMAAATDFNGDGNVDILWQNLVTGQRALWLMNGGDFTPTGIVNLGWVDTTWSIAGAADFNGDGRIDILWQNTTTGQRALWLMNGGDFTPTSVVNLGWVSPDWSMAAGTDFNGDGRMDILWQNLTTGQRALWLMNGGDFSPTSIVNLGWVDTSWSMATAIDFNGDGRVDIVWENTTTGQRALWLMNGGDFTPTNIVNLGFVPADWSLVK